MNAPIPIAYTFGNHMHWVDMEWLWGYHVLPGSVRDMLTFCREADVRGNVNFDAVGYERLAVECPEAFFELREAVRSGVVEIVGGSYGQPYGGLHGAESNIRQRTFGIRTILRLFGVRPVTFWEEEFDFFPQLPQMLCGSGFSGGALFFQWTWHTPEMPIETTPTVFWEAPDGSRLRCVTRNRLNLHQWPEDMQILMDQLADGLADGSTGLPIVLQWLELMPSPDWMCRSELLLPKARALLADSRFEFVKGTLGDHLRIAKEDVPVRRYRPDEVFHGMTLGKNGDGFRRLSQRCETSLLAAEALATVAARAGRPYPQWDVYPTWELEEAWRELMIAQHHDNDECEGLCRAVGEISYRKSLALAQGILDRTVTALANRIEGDPNGVIAFNPLGWPLSASSHHPVTGQPIYLDGIPAFGWKAFGPHQLATNPGHWEVTDLGVFGNRNGLEVHVDPQGRITRFRCNHWSEEYIEVGSSLLHFWSIENGSRVDYQFESMEVEQGGSALTVRFQHPEQGGLRVDLRFTEEVCALDVTITAGSLPRMDPGMNAGLRTCFTMAGGIEQIVTDSPYAFHSVEGGGPFRKKYPTGDWMTSPQWFEQIEGSIHSLHSVDLLLPNRGMFIVHDGSQQWFRKGDCVECLLTSYDPWDEQYWVNRFQARFRLIPHHQLSNSERYRLVRSFLTPCGLGVKTTQTSDLPSEFSFAQVSDGTALLTSIYRETKDRGEHLPDYAPRCFEGDYPIFARLVEFDGNGGTVSVQFFDEVASAARVDLLGEASSEVVQIDHSTVTTEVKPNQIATLALDVPALRKKARNLDAHREVWATVHRTEE